MKDRNPGDTLQPWPVRDADVGIAEIRDAGIGNNAHDLDRAQLRIRAKPHLLADRAAVRKELPLQAGTDHRDRGAALVVAPREIATVDQRNANRLEEVRRN